MESLTPLEEILEGYEDTTPEETTPDAGVVVQNPSEPAPEPAAPVKKARRAPVVHECDWCGKRVKGAGPFARHRKACKKRPKDAEPAKPAPKVRQDKTPPEDFAEPKKLDDWTAEQAAQRAAKMVDEVAAEGGTVVDVMARMDAGQVGVPDLIALVCLRALPPPLSDQEYEALRMAYRERNITLPPWLMTLVVTMAVLGPRVAAHPVAGPWLREQLVGKRVKPKPQPMRPPPPPPPQPKPEPAESRPEAKADEAKAAVRAAMDSMR